MNETILTAGGPATIEAAAGSQTRPKVKGVAYNGGKMSQAWLSWPVVVDLAGMEIPANNPLLVNHENRTASRIGLIQASTDGKTLAIEGEIVSTSATAQGVIEQAQAGADWQLSLGAEVLALTRVEQGSMKVNGQEHQAPFYLAVKSVLREVSVVAVGADKDTHMQVTAALTLKGGIAIMDENPNTPAQPTQSQQVTGAAPSPQTQPPAPVAPAAPAQPQQPAQGAIQAAAATEQQRIVAILEVCAGEHPEIQAEAIRTGLTREQTSDRVLQAMRAGQELQTVRGGRAPNVIVRGQPSAEELGQTLQAAMFLQFAIPEQMTVAECGEKAVQAAHQRYRFGIGLQQLLIEAAAATGCPYRDFRNNHREILEAAFSTISLPGILSNVANKRILASFDAVENVWEQISAIGNVSDFKEITSYRLTGALEFKKVGPDGELKHGELGEESLGNKAETFGLMLSITRQMQINDDMGALDKILARLGRGAALKLNSVFWTEFKANSTFFTTGNKNYQAGAGTALSISGLTAADLLFSSLTDADGNPIAIEAKILLVPNALKVTARQLMKDTSIVAAGATDVTKTSGNPWAGMYKPLASSYLNDSALAYYLLADPNDLPVIETVFLNGVRRPTVESTDADFDTLGIKCRGYFDFGVRKQDTRGGIKMKGEA